MAGPSSFFSCTKLSMCQCVSNHLTQSAYSWLKLPMPDGPVSNANCHTLLTIANILTKHTASLRLNLGGVLLETEIVLRNNFLCQEGCLPKVSTAHSLCCADFMSYGSVQKQPLAEFLTSTCHQFMFMLSTRHLHPAPIAPKVC